MTINKSQGQTLGTCGVYLPSPVFSHGISSYAPRTLRLSCPGHAWCMSGRADTWDHQVNCTWPCLVSADSRESVFSRLRQRETQ